MRPSASIRYSLARLRALANPLALIPLTIVALMIVLIVEYGRDPSASQWQGAGELTPDQEAEAQFDTLRQLLNESPPGSTLSNDAPTPESLGQTLSDRAALIGNAASGDEAGNSTENNAEPFAEYLEQYRFGGNGQPVSPSTRRNNSSNQLATPIGGSQNTPLPLGTSGEQPGLGTAAATGESELSLAISRLQGQPVPATPASEAEVTEGTIAEDTTNAESEISGLPNLPSSSSGIVRGSLPGSDTPFIRTTPNMSPPPGTTGYTPPSSLGVHNRALNGTATPALPAASTAPLDLQQQLPGASTNVLPTPGSVTLPTAPTVPQAAETNNDFFEDQRSAYESFWD